VLLGDQHGGVAVEADGAAVDTAQRERGAHHDGTVNLALLDATARDRLLDGDDDDIADRGILAARAAQHLDALHAPGAGVVGDLEVGPHLDHGLCSPRALGLRALDQNFPVLGLGHRAAFGILTFSPTLPLKALVSSCAWYFFDRRMNFL